MKSLRRILLYGSSIYLLSLESILRSLSGVEVFWLDDNNHDLVESIATYDPDVILTDVSSDDFPDALKVMTDHPETKMITLDKAQQTVTVLSSQKFPANTMYDLTQALDYFSYSEDGISSS